MQTIVFFHAHPDDEVIVTGGTIAKAAAEGRRAVLVVATNGDHGDVPEDLAHDETLIDRRRRETEASAAVLGVQHVLWLGYADSGMTGWTQNDHPESFWKADIDDAGSRLAKILVAEQADALVVYDWHGVYGHPDHVQVHRVGTRAAEIAGTPRVLEATMNRTQLIEYADKMGMDDFDPAGPADDGNPFGTLEEELHWGVDVGDYLARKRAALSCHASQVSDAGEMLKMPDDIFALAFGWEWFREPGRQPGLRLAWPFAE
jgi:LmbE family N-acetylglucosaminyl deacetylase